VDVGGVGPRRCAWRRWTLGGVVHGVARHALCAAARLSKERGCSLWTTIRRPKCRPQPTLVPARRAHSAPAVARPRAQSVRWRAPRPVARFWHSTGVMQQLRPSFASRSQGLSLGLLGAFLFTSACGGLTREEAQESLEEVKLSSQSQALTTESVELGTHFT